MAAAGDQWSLRFVVESSFRTAGKHASPSASALRKISQGYWPEDSGETEISKTNLRSIDWARFGGLFVEGLSSISQALMRHLADQADQDWRGSY